MKKIKVGVLGCEGRMGRKVLAGVLAQSERFSLQGGLVEKDSKYTDCDIASIVGGESLDIKITDNLENLVKNSDAIIDFSAPKSTLECAKLINEYGKILVSGTTGLSQKENDLLVEYSKNCYIMWSSNMSILVNILFALSGQVASLLKDDFDTEIIEMHHNKKIDSPSGTAITIGQEVAKAKGLDFNDLFVMRNKGNIGARSKNEIGFSALRGGGVIGEHNIMFVDDNEKLEIKHTSFSRNVYASGALKALKWMVDNPNLKKGLYSMSDMVNLNFLGK